MLSEEEERYHLKYALSKLSCILFYLKNIVVVDTKPEFFYCMRTHYIYLKMLESSALYQYSFSATELVILVVFFCCKKRHKRNQRFF